MTTKTDYTTEEWNQLIVAPVAAGMLVIFADLSTIGFVAETKAMKNAMQEPAPDAPAQELVSSITADAKELPDERWKDMTKAIDTKTEEDIAASLQRISGPVAMLEGKTSAKETAAFKQWVLAVAQAVAKASREGSLFGKKVLVSDKEKARIEEIKLALGL